MPRISSRKFADRLEQIMEPIISRPSFQSRIMHFKGDMSAYVPYGAARFSGVRKYIRSLCKILDDSDKIDRLNARTPPIDLACVALHLSSLYAALDNGHPKTSLKFPSEDRRFLEYAFEDVWAYVRAGL